MDCIKVDVEMAQVLSRQAEIRIDNSPLLVKLYALTSLGLQLL